MHPCITCFYDVAMTNPAAALLEVFNQWKGEGSVAAVRFGEGSDISVPQHLWATKCLWDIHRIVERWREDGEPVAHWEAAIAAWTRYVLAYDMPWNGASSNASLFRSRAQLSMLAALAQLLSAAEPDVHSADVPKFDDFLNKIVELLAEDEGLSAELRAYILQLVQEIRSAVESFKLNGQFDASDAVRKLWVAMGAAASESKGKAARWRAFRRHIVAPAAAGFLGSLPGVTTDVVLAISQGS